MTNPIADALRDTADAIERREFGGTGGLPYAWKLRAALDLLESGKVQMVEWRPIDKNTPKNVWLYVSAKDGDGNWVVWTSMQFIEHGNRMEGEDYDALVWASDYSIGCPDEPTHYLHGLTGPGEGK